MIMIKESIGNEEILLGPKTAFLCSRRVPPSIVLKSFDWAREMCRRECCVISGNHSQIEKDVFHFLLKGKQPLILALARGMKRKIDTELETALSNNRISIITPFAKAIKRASEKTARKRNKLMVEMAEEVFVAYAHPGGNIECDILEAIRSGKNVTTFDVFENAGLIKAGANIYSNSM